MKKIIVSLLVIMLFTTSIFSASARIKNSNDPINDPPIANDDYYSTNEDTTLNVQVPGVLQNDTDPENDILISILVSGVSNGVLNLNLNGAFEYTPNTNYYGEDSFIYKAYDGTSYSNNATATITVNPINDPPTANNDYYTTPEDTTLTITAPGILTNDTDPENDPLIAILVSNVSNGYLTFNSNGGFEYTPDLNYAGIDTFTYKANDGFLNSTTATVQITISQINDPPVVNDDNYTTNEDITLNVGAPGVLINDIDPEDDPLIAILVSDVSNGDLTLNSNGGFEYTPDLNYEGTDTFTYKANDSSLDSNIATVTITVNPINDPPVANNDYYNIDEDIFLNVTSPGVLTNDTDVENEPLTSILVSDVNHGSLNLNSIGGFEYTPNLNYEGTDTFTYKANDGTSDSNIATVTITINPVNDPPDVPSNPNPADGETDIPVEIVISWTGGDPDGDDVTYDVYFGDVSPPPLVFDNQTSTNYNPGTLELFTTYYWQIVAWDENSVSTTGPIWNFTTRTNDPPYTPSNPTPANNSNNVDVNINLKWNGGDPDGDSVTYDIYLGATNPPPLFQENQTSTTFEPGLLNYSTKYYWQIVAIDFFGAETKSPVWTFITEKDTNQVPIRPTIEGVQGIHVPSRNYDYDIVTTDPDGDDVLYYVDWGDGKNDDWSGPYESGQNITKVHAWPKITRLYEIRVKAKDIYGGESGWGKLYVFVLNSRSASNSFFIRCVVRLIERFPIFEKILTSGPIIKHLMRLQ
jgi:VCBS repeat-containing protein